MIPQPAPVSPILGKLSLDALPLHEPIVVATFAVVALGGIGLFAALTYFRLWGYLWKEWFTSVDHKKIGIMYMILGLVMFLRGFADALMMRLQQALAFNGSEGYLNAHHYDQVFTAHGVIMIFFVAMPFVTGLMNYIVPLQIGARDVVLPFPEQLQLLDDGRRRHPGHDLAVCRRVRQDRLAGLPAAVGPPGL